MHEVVEENTHGLTVEHPSTEWRPNTLQQRELQSLMFRMFPELSYFLACDDAVDIGFAIPSNSFAQFEDLRDFIKRTLDYVVLGTDNVHVGLMIYDKDAEVYIKFDQEFDLTELKKLMNSITYVDNERDQNRLDVALEAAATDLFTLRSGVRQGNN